MVLKVDPIFNVRSVNRKNNSQLKRLNTCSFKKKKTTMNLISIFPWIKHININSPCLAIKDN